MSNCDRLGTYLHFRLRRSRIPISHGLMSLVYSDGVGTVRRFRSRGCSSVYRVLCGTGEVFVCKAKDLRGSIYQRFREVVLSLGVLIGSVPTRNRIHGIMGLVGPSSVFFIMSGSKRDSFVHGVVVRTGDGNIAAVSLAQCKGGALTEVDAGGLFMGVRRIAMLRRAGFRSVALVFVVLRVLFTGLMRCEAGFCVR